MSEDPNRSDRRRCFVSGGGAALPPRQRPISPVEREILSEMASALGRAAERITSSLSHLREIETTIGELEARLARAPELKARLAEEIERYNGVREVAQQRRWELMVHREALGLYHHDVLDRFYPVPPRRARG